MTVKELKQLLKDYPDDSHVFINLWIDDDVEYMTPHHSEYRSVEGVDHSSFHLTIRTTVKEFS